MRPRAHLKMYSPCPHTISERRSGHVPYLADSGPYPSVRRQTLSWAPRSDRCTSSRGRGVRGRGVRHHSTVDTWFVTHASIPNNTSGPMRRARFKNTIRPALSRPDRVLLPPASGAVSATDALPHCRALLIEKFFSLTFDAQCFTFPQTLASRQGRKAFASFRQSVHFQ